jgi:hypothetical protein
MGGEGEEEEAAAGEGDAHFVVRHSRGATHVRVPWLRTLARRASESTGGPAVPNSVDLPPSALRLILETDDASVHLTGVAAVADSAARVALHLSSDDVKIVDLSPLPDTSSSSSSSSFAAKTAATPTPATPASSAAPTANDDGATDAAALSSLPPPSSLPPIPAPPPRLVLRDWSSADPLRPTTTQVSQVAAAAASVGETARRLRGAGAARSDRVATLLAIAETQRDVAAALATDTGAVRTYAVEQVRRIARLEEVQAVLTQRLDTFLRIVRALGEPELSLVERKVFDDLQRTADLVATTHAQIEGLRELVDDVATRAEEVPPGQRSAADEEPLDPALREVLARQTSRIEGLVSEVTQLTNDYRRLVQAPH